MTAARLASVFLGLLCTSGGEAAERVWTHFPQHALSSGQPPLFIDLDGDGSNEILLVLYPIDHGVYEHVLAVLAETGAGLKMVDQLAVPSFQGLAVVPGPGPTSIVFADRSDSTPNFLEVGGLPLRIQRSIDVGIDMEARHIGDIDGNGDLEILGETVFADPPSGRPVVVDYLTGELQWQSETIPTTSLAIAQLDGDDALEIIVGAKPGLILDGATFQQDWLYPSGFPGGIVVGSFEAVGVPTFATCCGPTIFRASPYSPLRTLTTSTTGTIVDADGDGLHELLSTSWFDRLVLRISPLDGSVLESYPIPWQTGPVAVSMGSAGSQSELLLAHGSALHESTNGVQVLGADTLTEHYRFNYELGSFDAASFANLGDAGALRVVSLTGRNYSNARYADVTVRSLGGEIVDTREQVMYGWDGDDETLILADDLDGILGDEIVVARSSSLGQASTVVMLDGKTLQDRWRINGGSGTPLDYRVLTAVTAVDFDSDHKKDVVFAARFWGSVRLLALSGLNGSVLWESPQIFFPGAAVPQIAVANVDDDPSEELLITDRFQVSAFDISTRLLEWSRSYGIADIFALSVWRDSGSCRLGIAGGPDRDQFGVVNCYDFEIIESIQLPSSTRSVQLLDADGSRFLATARGHAYVVGSGATPARMTSHLGSALRLATGRNLLRDSSGNTDVLLGSNMLATRLRIGGDEIFFNGFDAVTAARSPEAANR